MTRFYRTMTDKELRKALSSATPEEVQDALVAGLTAFIAAVATYALLGPYGLIGLATVAVFVLIIRFVIAVTADNPNLG